MDLLCPLSLSLYLFIESLITYFFKLIIMNIESTGSLLNIPDIDWIKIKKIFKSEMFFLNSTPLINYRVEEQTICQHKIRTP